VTGLSNPGKRRDTPQRRADFRASAVERQRQYDEDVAGTCSDLYDVVRERRVNVSFPGGPTMSLPAEDV